MILLYMLKGSLENAAVSTPCEADWEQMAGDDAVRFCSHCSRNVYHLSAMTREQAQKLIQEKEGKLCIRFYRRPDGSLVTTDCVPRPQRSARCGHRTAAALFSALAAVSVPAIAQELEKPGLVSIQNAATVVSGQAVDVMGAAIPDALVVILDKTTERKISTRSDQQGTFRFTLLAPGEYTVQIEAPGFFTQTRALRLMGQAEVRMEMSMIIAPSMMGVYVESIAEAPKTLHISPEPKRRKKRADHSQ